jgi:DNA repair exonuclease SbcCD ATPase subunit
MTHSHHEAPHHERDSSDCSGLLRELDEARKTIRTLLRQMKKTQDQLTETQRAYTKTVANMVEIARENTTLSRECEMWKAKAQSAQAHLPAMSLDGMTLELSMEETQAIRRAMARLHHPDAGGNVERMKAWNATLDEIESRHKPS